jgi:hypothetical protein
MKEETAKLEARQQLTGIIGSELGAITFVRDYIQLHFDGPTINAYTLPVAVVEGAAVAPAALDTSAHSAGESEGRYETQFLCRTSD